MFKLDGILCQKGAQDAPVPSTSDDCERVIPRRRPTKENGVGTSSIMIMPKCTRKYCWNVDSSGLGAHISPGRPRTLLIPRYSVSYPIPLRLHTQFLSNTTPAGRHDLVFQTSLAISVSCTQLSMKVAPICYNYMDDGSDQLRRE